MQTKKGFTLIELLVVIAIIAILAAILFPVFANARDKARQISDLSNIKQIALSAVMYTGDYDDRYPIGAVIDNNGTYYAGWVDEIAPYFGSIAVLYGPDDTMAGKPLNGKAISYGANGLTGLVLPAFQHQRLGVFATTRENVSGWWNAIANSATCKLSEATQPTQTILFADYQSVDVAKITNVWIGGNPSGISSVSLIANDDIANDYGIFNTGNNNLPYNSSCGQSWCSYYGDWMIPNPYRPATAAYPAGPAGAVSSPFSSKSLTNFAFMDGHAKSMKPAATNPDGIDSGWLASNNYQGGMDQDNLWVVAR